MESTIILKNETSIAKIGSDYWPLINQAIIAVKEILNNHIVEIRLLGSVPSGNAIIGNSDIDFLAITNKSVDDNCKSRIEETAREFSKKSPVVSSIDIDVMSQEEIGRHPAYELIIRTDSVSLYGSDKYTVKEYQISNTELAHLWNIDFDSIIISYRRKLISSEISELEIKKYSKFTGKDIMKCFRRRLILDYGICDRRIDMLYGSLKRYLPEHSVLFDALWGLYRYPNDNIDAILRVMDEAENSKKQIMTELNNLSENTETSR